MWYFFAQIIIYYMLTTGKKYAGYLDKLLHQSVVGNGHSNEKIAEKHPCFSLQKAEGVISWCLEAVFS